MDHVQAKAEVDDLFAQAQQIVGGDWQVADSGAESCNLVVGSGARYALTRIGAGIAADQTDSIVKGVVDAWTTAGFAPTVTELPPVNDLVVIQVRYPASGYGVDGLYLQFWAGTEASTLEGLTRCVPGDANEINGSK
jgi:hypothetical protein